MSEEDKPKEAKNDKDTEEQETGVQRNLVIEVARIGEEQAVQERDIEKTLGVEKAKIAQEQIARQRDVEKTSIVETARIDQIQQEAEIQEKPSVEVPRIGQEHSLP